MIYLKIQAALCQIVGYTVCSHRPSLGCRHCTTNTWSFTTPIFHLTLRLILCTAHGWPRTFLTFRWIQPLKNCRHPNCCFLFFLTGTINGIASQVEQHLCDINMCHICAVELSTKEFHYGVRHTCCYMPRTTCVLNTGRSTCVLLLCASKFLLSLQSHRISNNCKPTCAHSQSSATIVRQNYAFANIGYDCRFYPICLQISYQVFQWRLSLIENQGFETPYYFL